MGEAQRVETTGALPTNLTVDAFHEWNARQPEGHYELIDGKVHVAASPNLRHQRISKRLLFQWTLYFDQQGRGEANADWGTRFGDHILEPDVSVFADDAETSPPVLVIEIISPSSATIDRQRKREIYAESGVPEYWIVDPDENAFTFLRLHRGRYREVAAKGDRYETALFPGFTLELTDFWERV